MMFRKLYWVTEQVDDHGFSTVTGVYTSIPDLMRRGLRWVEGKGQAQFRITLAKLDCSDAPYGTFTSPNYEGLDEKLGEFVRTDEFTEEHRKMLVTALDSFAKAKV